MHRDDDQVSARRSAADVLAAFHRVVVDFPWYRMLLAEHDVSPATIVDLDAFRRHCPLLTRTNTFERFPIAELAATTTLTDLATVLTSSGHGGRFSFGLTTRAQEQAAADAIDHALDASFAIRARPTLAINCLPMGVGFTSRCMTIATTSVREDMALALVETFGPAFAQVLLVADPLFLKRLTDHAIERGTDWRRHRVQVVVGEEVFGEHFRTCMTQRLGLGADAAPDTWLMSSFGVGELGLHLCFETPATIALRRRACADQAFAHRMLGQAAVRHGMPMVFAYEPSRTYIEVDAPDADGFGRLTISMLDPSLPVPLLRYQTGDVARLLDRDEVQGLVRSHGITLSGPLPAAMIALRGREREALPNGAHVALYKDAIYADHAVADRLTGAVRLHVDGLNTTLHLQLVRHQTDDAGIAASVRAVLPDHARPRDVVVWRYEQFPFGMTLDYERKFKGVDAG